MEYKPSDIMALSTDRLGLIELLLLEETDAQAQILPSQAGGMQEFPLSFAQQRLWFLDRLNPGNYIYNESVAVRLTGNLKQSVLEQSLSEIIRRHESLRTTFTVVEGKPVQVIAPARPLHLIGHDLSGLAERAQEEKIEALFLEETQYPFDLKQGPLIRLSLLTLNPGSSIVLLTVHHIVSDGWSMSVFIHELTTLYAAFLQNAHSPLPELPIQYRDFAAWQQQWLQGEVLEQQLTYWKKQLQGPLPVLQLPIDRPRTATQTFQGATHFFGLPAALSTSLKMLCQQEDASIFMVLQAAFKVLLHYYSGQDDLILGTDVANRNRAETEGLIGFFVNQLVLRTNLAGNPTFREVLQRVREGTLGAFAHQDLPFNRLVEMLNPERDLSRTPLFQVKFVLQSVPMPSLELPDLTLSLMQFDRGIAKFDLLLNMWDTADGLTGALDYNTDLFDATTTLLLLDHFQAILQQIANNLDADLRLEALEEMLHHMDGQQRTERYQDRRSANRELLTRRKRGKSEVLSS